MAPPPPAAEPDGDSRDSKRTVIAFLVFTGVVAALWTIGPIVFASHDDPTAIDTKPVRTAVEAACPQLRTDLAALPAGMPAPERAEAENRVVERFLSRVRAVGPEALRKDVPIEKWLADWERIVAGRRAAVRDGKRFVVAMDEGTPINVRMFSLIRSGLSECNVPPALLTPEPGRV